MFGIVPTLGSDCARQLILTQRNGQRFKSQHCASTSQRFTPTLQKTLIYRTCGLMDISQTPVHARSVNGSLYTAAY